MSLPGWAQNAIHERLATVPLRLAIPTSGKMIVTFEFHYDSSGVLEDLVHSGQDRATARRPAPPKA